MNAKFAALMERFAPSQMISIAVSCVAGIVSLGVYFFLIDPQQTGMQEAREEMHRLVERQRSMTKIVQRVQRSQDHINEMKLTKEKYEKSNFLQAELQSFAMGCRTKVMPLAESVGLNLATFSEAPVITLPLPAGAAVTTQLYARQPIVCQGTGSYRQLVAFLRALEKAYPMTALSGITITANVSTPERHSIALTLEWPVRGAVRDLNPKKGKK